MSNPIPSNSSQIIVLAGRMQVGLAALGAELGITQITAAQLQTDLSAFVASDDALCDFVFMCKG